MEIGKKIRAIRTGMNMTQEELAGKLNVTPQAISRWENDISLPDISMVPLLARTLNVSTETLLFDDSEKHESDDSEKHESDDSGKDKIHDSLYGSCKNLKLEGEILNQDQTDSLFADRESVTDNTAKKVLVVDDAAFLRMMLKDMLSQNGHTVIAADNGKAGLEMFKSEKPDICILDINMPEINGLEVLKHIVSVSSETKVIMLSALAQKSVVQSALELGASAFVAKPFQADSIIRRVGYAKS